MKMGSNFQKLFLCSTLIFSAGFSQIVLADPPCPDGQAMKKISVAQPQSHRNHEVPEKIVRKCVPLAEVKEGDVVYVPIDDLHPTQVVVGNANVESNLDFRLFKAKANDDEAKRKAAAKYVESGESPGFIGPDKKFYISDGHHRATLAAMAQDRFKPVTTGPVDPIYVPITVQKRLDGGYFPKGFDSNEARLMKYLCGENRLYLDAETRDKIRDELKSLKANHKEAKESIDRVVKVLNKHVKAAVPDDFKAFVKEPKFNSPMRSLVGKAFDFKPKIDADKMRDYIQLYAGEILDANGFEMPSVVNFVKPDPGDKKAVKHYYESLMAAASARDLLLQNPDFRAFLKANPRSDIKKGVVKLEVDAALKELEKWESKSIEDDELKGVLKEALKIDGSKEQEFDAAIHALAAHGSIPTLPGSCLERHRSLKMAVRAQAQCPPVAPQPVPATEQQLTSAVSSVATQQSKQELSDELEFVKSLGFGEMKCLVPYQMQATMFPGGGSGPSLASGATIGLMRSMSSGTMASIDAAFEHWTPMQLRIIEEAISRGYRPPCGGTP